MLTTHHSHPRRRLAALLGAATTVMAFGTVLPTVAKADGIEASEHFQRAFAQFTDCPALPTSGTISCSATEVNGILDREAAGDQAQPTDLNSQALVIVFDVTLTPTNFTATIRSSSFVPARVRIDSVEGAHVAGSATLDDGTTTTFDVAWRAVGPVSKSGGPGGFTDSLCPSGFADGSFRGKHRDAVTTGSVITNGVAQIPTSAFRAPFVYDEFDKGFCA
jgi:hypothetical protein